MLIFALVPPSVSSKLNGCQYWFFTDFLLSQSTYMLIESARAAGSTLFVLCGAKRTGHWQRTLIDGSAPSQPPTFWR
jgi:hypothetical protein